MFPKVTFIPVLLKGYILSKFERTVHRCLNFFFNRNQNWGKIKDKKYFGNLSNFRVSDQLLLNLFMKAFNAIKRDMLSSKLSYHKDQSSNPSVRKEPYLTTIPSPFYR